MRGRCPARLSDARERGESGALPPGEQRDHDGQDQHHDTDGDLQRCRHCPAQHRTPPGTDRSSGTPLVGVLEERRPEEGPEKPADHRANEKHRYPNDGADDTADQRTPAGATRSAVAPGKAEPDPRFQHFTQEREADLGQKKPETVRIEVGVPAVSDDPQQDDPQTRQTQRDEYQAAETDDDEEEEGEGFVHLGQVVRRQQVASRESRVASYSSPARVLATDHWQYHPRPGANANLALLHAVGLELLRSGL